MIKRIMVSISLLFLILILVMINDYRDRMIITESYEKAFLKYFNEGKSGLEGKYEHFRNKFIDINNFDIINNNNDKISVSDCIEEYIKFILLINSISYEDAKQNFYRYGNIEFRHNGALIGKVEWPEFTKASLSELNETMKMDDLCEILEDKFDHSSESLYEYWFINKYEDMDIILPGGIRFIYKSPKKRVIENKHFTKVKILNSIYDINLFTREKSYNDIDLEVFCKENDKIKTYKFTLQYRNGLAVYLLDNFFNEIYGNTIDYEGRIKMYNPLEEDYKEKSFNPLVKDAYGYYGFSPDAVHNACIGNYDTSTFNECFKKKLKDKGFLNNLKIKDTKKISIERIHGSSKELRELILDDGNETKIMCLFKIIYPDIEEGYDDCYEGGGPEEVGDILTYIIPEDKMNLSYEEMYQLAFND